MNNNLSAYQITWAEFFPKFGIVTVHDQKAFGSIHTKKGLKTFRKEFVDKNAAKSFCRNFDKVLDCGYVVRFFTDEQFGMAKESDGYKIPYTEKQWNDIDYIESSLTVDDLFCLPLGKLDEDYIARKYRNASYKERVNYLISCIKYCEDFPRNQSPRRVAMAAKKLVRRIF